MKESETKGPHDGDGGGGNEPSRRQFIQWAALGLQGLIAAMVAVPVLGPLLFPLWGRVSESVSGFVSVGAVDRFQVGVPTKVVVSGDRRDAWTRATDVALGAAWVIRRAANEFEVFTTVCPHLGCAIQWESAKVRFLCPCHGSHFSERGELGDMGDVRNPAPRGMDPLRWRVEQGRLWVHYERFRTGTVERIEMG